MAELDTDTLGENMERFLMHNEDHVKLVNHIACYVPSLCVTSKSAYEQHRFTKQEMFRKWCNLTYDPFSPSSPYGMVPAKYYMHMVGAPKSESTPTTGAFYDEVHDTLERILTIMTNRWILFKSEDHPFKIYEGGNIYLCTLGMNFRIKHRTDIEFGDGVTFGHFHDKVCDFMGELSDHFYNLRPVSVVRRFNAIECLPDVEIGALPFTGTHVGDHPPANFWLSPI